MSEFGKWLREIREARGYGLNQFARKIDCSPSELSRIETGERQHPNAAILKRIAEALNLPPRDLLIKVGYLDENPDDVATPPSATPEAQSMARRIRYLRKQQDVDQKRFAEAIGVTPETVAAYENGTKQPDHSTVIRMAEYCKVTPGYLYGAHDLVNDELPGGAAEGWREDSLLKDIIEDYRQLPPEVREEIRDYIAFVRARQTLRKQRREKNTN